MRLLVLGGTAFLGRHLVGAALSDGHDVTLFNRGTRHVRWKRPIEHIQGDRNADVDKLRNRRWDVVVDFSGYLPDVVSASAVALRDSVEQYVFISTVSVYANAWRTTECSKLALLSAEQMAAAEKITPPARSVAGGGYGTAYPGLKAACERRVLQNYESRSLIVRPGFIVGPYDYSPRWPYWVSRGMAGGEILAPGSPSRPVRVVDARDIAEWILRMVMSPPGGIFNVTGADGLCMGSLVAACAGLSPQSRVRWLTEDWLLAEGVKPFSDIPYWLPDADNVLLDVRNDAAVARGLTFRSLEKTANDTSKWLSTLFRSDQPVCGLNRSIERSLIARWLKSQSRQPS